MQFFVFNFITFKKLTVANNFWQFLEQNKIQPVCQKNAVPLYFFNEVWKVSKRNFGTWHSWFCSYFKKGIWKCIFLGFVCCRFVCFFFFEKTCQKKWIFKNGKQSKEVTLVLESLLKLFKEHYFHCIAYFGAPPTI